MSNWSMGQFVPSSGLDFDHCDVLFTPWKTTLPGVSWSVLWSQNLLFPVWLRLSKSFGSGSRSDISFDLPFIADFILKKWIFHVFLWKNINLIHMLDSMQMNFDFYLLLKLTRSREPEPKLQHFGSSSGQKFRLLAARAQQHCSWWHMTKKVTVCFREKVDVMPKSSF
jgi:hypothetical protein